MPASIVVIAETGFGELTPESLECVEEAREVADGIGADVHAILPGDEVEALADELAAHGADRVTVIEHQALAQFTADGWLAAVPPLLQEARPILTLAPDSGYTCAWLPRLSVRWRIPMATGCIRVKLTDEGYPEVFRVSHNGRLHERQIWARGTAVMVLLCPGCVASAPAVPIARPTCGSSGRRSPRRRSATGRCAPILPIRRMWTLAMPKGSSPAGWASADRRAWRNCSNWRTS